MKKIFFTAKHFLIGLLAFLVPAKAFAVDTKANCQNFLSQFGGAFDWAKDRQEFCTVQAFLLWLLKNGLMFAGVIAVVFIVIGGYQYLISGGNEETAEKGKNTLMHSVIGLAIIIMSYVIVRVVTNFLTSPGV